MARACGGHGADVRARPARGANEAAKVGNGAGGKHGAGTAPEASGRAGGNVGLSRPMEPRPTVRLLPGRHKRLRAGHPWAYANEIAMSAEARALPPGTLVRLESADGQALGAAMFNPRALAAARRLDPDPEREIDAGWLAARLAAALALRRRLGLAPWCRAVHAEADGLPGLIVDLFGGAAVAQLNSAGMARLEAPLVEALREVLRPEALLFRNDSAQRGLEGLDTETRVVFGEVSGPVDLVEGGCRFLCDPLAGQKTGWFHDQRDNRAFAAGLAGGARVLDLYAYLGGFGIRAALAGAREVVMVDRSRQALELAARAAGLNGVGGRVRTERADAFAFLEAAAPASFGLVIADPPAFVRARKDLGAGLRGYRKLARLAARLVAPGGFLLAASCSHTVAPEAFAAEVARGLVRAGRTGRVLRMAGAAPDHPVHPMLPESAYLKAMVLQLD